MKKALCLLMSILLLVSAFSFCVSAADKTYKDYTYTVLENGTVKIIKYNGDDKKVTIPKKIKGKTVTVLSKESFWYLDILEEVVIPETIETIGKSAFKECHNLKKVTIKNGIKIIKSNAFAYCDKLESIVIPDSVTEIGKLAFFECEALKEIKLSKNLTEIGYEILLGSGYSKNKENWDGYFLYVDKYLITTKGNIKGTAKIKEGTVIIADGSFSGSHLGELKSVILPKSLKRIGYEAFISCHNLEKVVINEGLEFIGDKAFFGCSSLKNIEIPAGIKEIGTDALGYKFGQFDYPDKKSIDGFTITGYANTEAEKYAEENKITFNCKKPKTPKVKITAKNRKIKVKYTKTTGADGFQIRYTRNGKTTTKTYSTLKSATKSTAKLSKGTYKVKVRAFTKTESKKLYSKWTAEKTVKVV